MFKGEKYISQIYKATCKTMLLTSFPSSSVRLAQKYQFSPIPSLTELVNKQGP